MSIEEAMMGGIVFKGKKDKPKEENKVKTKAKKKTYITGLHGSGAAKIKLTENFVFTFSLYIFGITNKQIKKFKEK